MVTRKGCAIGPAPVEWRLGIETADDLVSPSEDSVGQLLDRIFGESELFAFLALFL